MNYRRLKKAIVRLSNLPKGRNFILYFANKVKYFYFKRKKSTRVVYPSTIMLELTNHCNLACTICPREYDYGKLMDKGQMSVAQAKMIIDELWPYLDSIGLTGMGETFLYKDIEEIVDYIKAKNRGIVISISTNAVLPNFIENASKLINKIDTIQISIDGLDEVYNNIRKKSDFQILDQNLRLMVELTENSKTDLMLNMVVTKENYTQMPLLVEYAGKVGVKYMDFTLLNLASVTNIERSYYDFYKSSEFKKVIGTLDKAMESTPSVVVTGRNFKTENSFQKCPYPWTHFYICWNGYIAPCCAKPFPKELNFGNVFESNVLTVLNSASYQAFRRSWFENKTYDFCNKCHLINIDPLELK